MPKLLRHIVWYLFAAVLIIPVFVITVVKIVDEWLLPIVYRVRTWAYQEKYYRPKRDG
jgi:uncharacterized membrane protein